MKPIEIYPHGHRQTVQLSVKDNATRMQIVTLVRQLVRRCNWTKARVGIGDLWSGFIY